MNRTYTFILTLGCLAGGIGLIVAGGIVKNDAMIASGTGLLGVVLGAIGLPRPQDAPPA